MCNLYSLNKKRDGVAQFFRVSYNRAVSYEPSSSIFAPHVAPVKVDRLFDGAKASQRSQRRPSTVKELL